MCRIELINEENQWFLKCGEETIVLSGILPENEIKKIKKDTNPKIIISKLKYSTKLTAKEKSMLKKWEDKNGEG